MEKQYNPRDVEDRLYKKWSDNGYFQAHADSKKEKYSIVIPPPNVTGVLHMGHALNNTIQDLLTRYKRMDGFEALWLPGTDHAGIATQNVVERKLAASGSGRHELGREAFVEEVWRWKEEYHATITKQLRQLGSSCDWDKERFTMDEGLSKAVRKVFVQLYKEGLVYRGKYIVNWCPRCVTALADDEVEHKEGAGSLWHFNYPLSDGLGHLAIATTRPETMLGDTAVAVNPKDERYSHLIGKTLLLPIVNREIPIIADDFVSRQFGTGCVKVTPAHDPNDYLMGQRHSLEYIVVLDEHAKVTGPVPQDYIGLDRFEARKKVVSVMDEMGLLIKIDDHHNSVGHCYRCDTRVEPYYSDQWFVKMKPLAEKALEAALNDEITFHPPRWKKTYIDWMENIRDWCISRQIWWGHRIPVWYCESCGELTVEELDPTHCSHCGSADLSQDTDVMDTWFSSWLWPFTTMGWPEKTDLLHKFFPTDTLVTAPDILFFWVARMVMSSLHFTGVLPFKDIVLHGTVRDKTGRKMSKSLGNSIDPLEIIDQVGTDALRFSMLMITAQGSDVFLGADTFDIGRNFANKLWNASRFLLGTIEDRCEFSALPSESNLKVEDRWILTRVAKTVDSVRGAFEGYRFNEACHTLYDFIWHDFCDWYIESKKRDIYNSDSAEQKSNAISVASYVLASALKVLHPVMPFVTEEIWGHLREKVSFTALLDEDSIMISQFPNSKDIPLDLVAEERFKHIQDMIVSLRTIRSENGVPPEKRVTVVIKPKDSSTLDWLLSYSYLFESFVKIENLTIAMDAEKPSFGAQGVVSGDMLFIDLDGLIDRSVEIERLQKEIGKLTAIAGNFEKKLNSEQFLSKAPANVVENEREKYSGVMDTLSKLTVSLKQLMD